MFVYVKIVRLYVWLYVCYHKAKHMGPKFGTEGY